MLDVGDVLILFYHISRTICWGVFLGAGITWVAHQPMLNSIGCQGMSNAGPLFFRLAEWRHVTQVLLDVQEGYQWNSLKGLRFLEWCSSNVLAEFLVKVDDDVRLDAFWDAIGCRSVGDHQLGIADGSEDDPTNPWM